MDWNFLYGKFCHVRGYHSEKFMGDKRDVKLYFSLTVMYVLCDLKLVLEIIYRVAQKWHNFLYALTSSNVNRFSKLFHCQYQMVYQRRRFTTINLLKQAIVTEWGNYCTVSLIAPLVSGVAGLSGSSRSKANKLNIWCKNCIMWVTLDNSRDNKHVVPCC